jgi:hypothetical protein
MVSWLVIEMGIVSDDEAHTAETEEVCTAAADDGHWQLCLDAVIDVFRYVIAYRC